MARLTALVVARARAGWQQQRGITATAAATTKMTARATLERTGATWQQQWWWQRQGQGHRGSNSCGKDDSKGVKDDGGGKSEGDCVASRHHPLANQQPFFALPPPRAHFEDLVYDERRPQSLKATPSLLGLSQLIDISNNIGNDNIGKIQAAHSSPIHCLHYHSYVAFWYSLHKVFYVPVLG